MKRSLVLFFLGFALPMVVFPGCGPVNQLRVPTEITRPYASGPPRFGPSGIGVAVADFSYAPPEEPTVIGRDSDRVRRIVWEGDPGRLMGDLVAGALSEQGFPAFRLKTGAPAPENSTGMVNGAVRRFEVNIRRLSVVNVHIEATVEITLFVSGRNAAPPWEASISSSAVRQEVIPLPGDVQKALASAVNSAADEAVRRLREKGAAGNPE